MARKKRGNVRRAKNENTRLFLGEKIILYYRLHPVEAAKDLLNVELSWFQRIILRSVWKCSYSLLVLGRACGKCVSKDTYLNTLNRGLIKAKDLFNTEPLFEKMKNGEEKEFILSENIGIDGRENVKQTRHLLLQKKIDCIKITTEKGYEIIGSKDRHKILVFDQTKNDYVYRKLKSLKETDLIPIKRKDYSFGSTHLDADTAYMLGMLIGDGYCKSRNQIMLSTSDQEFIDLFHNYFADYKVHHSVKYKNYDYTIYNTKLRTKLFEDYGLDYSGSWDKTVPKLILNGDRDTILNFLAGLYDADGTVDKLCGTASYSTVSKELAVQIQQLLLKAGIVSTRRIKNGRYKGEVHKSWIISITPVFSRKFFKIVPTRLERKKFQFSDHLFSHDHLPQSLLKLIREVKEDLNKVKFKRYGKGNLDCQRWSKIKRVYAGIDRLNYVNVNKFLSYFDSLNFEHKNLDKIKEIIEEGFYFDTVRFTEEVKEDCVDFYIPDQHNYIGNGFVNHNTAILAIISVLQALLYPNMKIGCLGPSARQGDLIFNEIDNLWRNSEYFRASAVGNKGPSRSPAKSIIKFHNNSFIESTPIGATGGKVRGARYNVLCLDEFAQFNLDIINLVIMPFMGVRQRDKANKLVMSSSAFYRHNHLWDRFKFFKRKIMIEGSKDYFLANYDYEDVLLDPNNPFVMDMDVIDQQKETMTRNEFEMEWCFPGNTLIQTNKRNKKISKINPGDYVLTHNGKFKKVIKTMSRFYEGNLVKITSNSRKIYCTPNHPIYVCSLDKFMFKPAIDVCEDDFLITPVYKSYKQMLLNKVVDVDKAFYEGQVFNLVVEDDNSYVANSFAVHNCGIFPDETDNYFSSRLVDDICTPKAPYDIPIELSCSDGKSNNGHDYILGVDIAKAPGQANFSVGVGRIEGNIIKLVYMITLNGGTYDQMVAIIRDCTLKFNVIRIQMDKGGGGEAIKEELAKPWYDKTTKETYLPILDMDDSETENANGLRYLRLVNFQGAKHSNLFTNLKAEMEHNRVLFPINLRRDALGNKQLERIGRELIMTKQELMVMASTPRGANLHFSVPNSFRMDRAVALALVVDAVIDKREPSWQTNIPQELPVGAWV